MADNLHENYKKVLEELSVTFENKNKDYGGAVDVTYLLFGDTAQLVRIWDKLLRLTQLHLSGVAKVESEKSEDTLRDLANYAIIAAAQKATYSGTPEELGKVFIEFVEKTKRRNQNE